MKAAFKPILLVLLCTIFTSAAQLFYKAGAPKLSFDLVVLITNWQIITGLILYGIGAIILIVALKGADLSLLYPVIATSYIWVALFSVILFKESVPLSKLIGIFFIILGVVFMGIGSSSSSPAYQAGDAS